MAEDPTPPDVAARETAEGSDPRVVVVTPQGMGIAQPREDGEPGPADMVSQPAKVMRIGSMIKQLLEEVRSADLDEAARVRLREIYETSLRELGSALSDDLREELDRLTLPFTDDQVPSDAELRIAQAQLVGWLEGLFQGVIGSLLAIGALLAAHAALAPRFSGVAQAGAALARAQLLPAPLLAVLLAAGAGLGLLSSAIAVRRHAIET